MKLYVYNQNCLRAGEIVSDLRIEQHSLEDHDGKDCDCNCACDWTLHEGTQAELIEEAERIEKCAEQLGGGNGAYYRKVAKTIRRYA